MFSSRGSLESRESEGIPEVVQFIGTAASAGEAEEAEEEPEALEEEADEDPGVSVTRGCW